MNEELTVKQDELNLLTQNEQEESSDDEIEIKHAKPKRELTDKQKETLQRGRVKRHENMIKKKEELSKIKEQEKSELDNKIVKKAIAIKKKQIKLEEILKQTPDENEDDEKSVKAPVKRITTQQAQAQAQPPKQQQPKEQAPKPQPPKYIFI